LVRAGEASRAGKLCASVHSYPPANIDLSQCCGNRAGRGPFNPGAFTRSVSWDVSWEQQGTIAWTACRSICRQGQSTSSRAAAVNATASASRRATSCCPMGGVSSFRLILPATPRRDRPRGAALTGRPGSKARSRSGRKNSPPRKNLRPRAERSVRVAVESAAPGEGPPAPHPQSPGVEPRPHRRPGFGLCGMRGPDRNPGEVGSGSPLDLPDKSKFPASGPIPSDWIGRWR
jgi:hypothetical protein